LSVKQQYCHLLEFAIEERKVMPKKYFAILPSLLLVALFVSFWCFPAAVPALGMASLLVTLSLAVSSIVGKHAQAEHRRFKIAKDVLIFIATLSLVIFFAGVAALLVNYYASLRFGAVAGFVSAMAASFAMGYLVKSGVGRLAKR